MSDTERCGYAVIDENGDEQPCDRPAAGWRWYQDCSHEDCLEAACSIHENVGGNRLHAAEAEVTRLRETVGALPRAWARDYRNAPRDHRILRKITADLCAALASVEPSGETDVETAITEATKPLCDDPLCDSAPHKHHGDRTEYVTPASVPSGGQAGPLDHDFRPVAGHPDDDECTYRSDGTDATYCGEPERAHGVGGQADGEDVAERVAREHWWKPVQGRCSCGMNDPRDYARHIAAAALAARPVLSREALTIDRVRVAEYLHEWERTCQQMGLRFTLDGAAGLVADAGLAAVLSQGQEAGR